MRLPHIRLTLRSVLIAVATAAGLMAVVRQVERTIHLREVEGCDRRVKEWRESAAEALRVGDLAEAARYRGFESDYLEQRRIHQRQLVGFPKSFSASSALAGQTYLWLVTLAVVRIEERKVGGRSIWHRFAPRPRPDIVWVWTGPGPFVIWLSLCAVAPIAMVLVGILFAVEQGYQGDTSLPSSLIAALAWLQFAHAQLGVVLVWGRRWQVLALGILAIVGTAFVAVIASTAVIGYGL